MLCRQRAAGTGDAGAEPFECVELTADHKCGSPSRPGRRRLRTSSPPRTSRALAAALPRARRRPDAHPRARPARAPAEKVAAGSNGPPLSVGQVLEHAGAGAGAAAGGLVGLRPAQLHPRGLAGLRCGTSPHARARTHARTHQITRTHTPTRTRGRAHAQAVDLLLLEGARERSCGCRAPPPPLHHHHHHHPNTMRTLTTRAQKVRARWGR